MNVQKIKDEILSRMNEEEDPRSGNILSGLLSWICRTEDSMDDLMDEAAILQDFGQIRQNIVEGMNRFVLLHQPVGHFLTAVLSNNLREAFARADNENQKTMFQIVSYCHNQIPGNCWGTPEKVKAWVEMDPKDFPDVEAPTETKEQDRQNREVIWGITKFKIEKRLREVEKEEGDHAE
jgi:hypothetical protein